MKKKEQKKKVAKSAAKGKRATASPQPQAQAKALERKRIEVAAHQLRSAPWNPRPEITSESVADITASIREIGLIQPLVVMKDSEKKPVGGVDFYLVVAGHRRFKACVDAGLSPIPCDVIDCDVPMAKRVTMIENLQRKDADPLMEADLIAGLIAGGMTQAEIAAETGRGEKWVARRANLRKLSKSWRKRVADGEQFTVDCLEHVAAYPEEMQERLKDAKGYSYYYGGTPETITWQQISSRFRNASRDLKSAAFNTADCLVCLNNTGCCPDLFDQDGGKNAKLGRCLCDRCWRDKQEAHVSETVSKAEKNGVKIVRKKPKWEYSATDHKTKTNTALYVYKDGDQTVVKWYEPPESGEKKAKSKEEKREEREAKRRENLLRTAKDEACEKFTDWVDEHAKDGDWPKWFVDAAIADMVREICDYGAGDLEAAVDAFAANEGFASSDAEADKLYKEYLAARDVQGDADTEPETNEREEETT